eukprot:CAMPEP_0171161516 /NCGR_PEP_ID=MMETSP0790-20130122/4113_1 /TAXON_ID=2925 /ORGANISM="Alexandrium catenella, Strain OF101" /LENGTH=85 /DNA_ID=CAMNT_0011626083 /DNA_START=114 /DNA_END=371 /DNA_ORIENTATION=+
MSHANAFGVNSLSKAAESSASRPARAQQGTHSTHKARPTCQRGASPSRRRTSHTAPLNPLAVMSSAVPTRQDQIRIARRSRKGGC